MRFGAKLSFHGFCSSIERNTIYSARGGNLLFAPRGVAWAPAGERVGCQKFDRHGQRTRTQQLSGNVLPSYRSNHQHETPIVPGSTMRHTLPILSITQHQQPRLPVTAVSHRSTIVTLQSNKTMLNRAVTREETRYSKRHIDSNNASSNYANSPQLSCNYLSGVQIIAG